MDFLGMCREEWEAEAENSRSRTPASGSPTSVPDARERP